MSSQTKDEVTDGAFDKLRAALGRTLSLEAPLAADEQVVAEYISKVGFWRRRTQLVDSSADTCQNKFIYVFKARHTGNRRGATGYALSSDPSAVI